MLAQNFKPHFDLGLQDKEYSALVAVLGMLERGELVHENTREPGSCLFDPKIKNGFNMDCSGAVTECGTVACIGGWVAILMGRTGDEVTSYVNSRSHSSSPLRALYWENIDPNTSPECAAIALRNFLTTGNPNWGDASALTARQGA